MNINGKFHRSRVNDGAPLKAYLRAGAKFGDGAVIDAQSRTTDVFTIMPLADLEERYRDYYGGPMEMPDSYVA
ncbi:MAG: hypothetical protein USCAAHI_01145 [Beijerinckiaceae bacterium]|nr:MAG: hypothetical protein USCAAHI_01145 [Beijerinckiaceae bacterium]